jgi:hypothetical protein
MNSAVALLTGLAVATTSSLASAQSAGDAERTAAPAAAAGELVDRVEVDTAEKTDSLEPKLGRRHKRMLLEALAIQAIGTAWYWRNTGNGWGASNVVDWQLGFERGALSKKLGFDSDGWRFDGNSFALNAICHPAFGALTYWSARKNNYGVLESFAISTLISGTWEMFTEWAEYGSINDALSTSTTGVPLGEAAYQLMHNWRRARYAVQLGAGAQNGDGFASFGGRIALDTLPTEGAGTVVGGRRVDVGLEIPTDGQGIRSIEAGVKTSLVGYYANGENHRVFAGVSGEFYYRDRNDREAREDDLLATVAIGPTVDAQLRTGDVTVDVGADLYADFGMLKAQGYDNWRTMNPGARIRNVMQDKARPYYYAAGATIDPRVNVGYRGVNVGGKVAVSLFSSLDGADRDQEMMTADPHMSDRDTSAEAWLGYSRGNVAATLDTRFHTRTGSMGASRGDSNDHTTMVTVAYSR